MADLVRAELRKITSTRLWWGLLAGAVLYTALNAAATAGFAGVDPGAGQPATPGLDTDEAIRSVYAMGAFTGSYIFALILGVTGMTAEYRYQTITPTFLVSPRRWRVVVAKMAAHFAVAVGYAVAALVAAFAAGGVVIALRGHGLGYGADRLWPTVLATVLAVGLWALVGIGVGTLVRNQVLAVLLAVGVTFLVEPLATLALGALELEGPARFLPSNASAALMEPGAVLIDYLSWWAGGLVLLGYAVLFAGVGLALSTRRDVT